MQHFATERLLNTPGQKFHSATWLILLHPVIHELNVHFYALNTWLPLDCWINVDQHQVVDERERSRILAAWNPVIFTKIYQKYDCLIRSILSILILFYSCSYTLIHSWHYTYLSCCSYFKTRQNKCHDVQSRNTYAYTYKADHERLVMYCLNLNI